MAHVFWLLPDAAAGGGEESAGAAEPNPVRWGPGLEVVKEPDLGAGEMDTDGRERPAGVETAAGEPWNFWRLV